MEGYKGIKIYNTIDSEWNNVLSELPYHKRDIYYTREYHNMFEGISGGRAELFTYKEGDMIGIYPYIRTPIRREWLDKEYSDIETVYGYGGPVVSEDSEDFALRFERSFCEYCKDRNIIAEFVRFHPLIRNEGVFKDIDVIHNRLTVSIDLSLPEDEIWMQQISTGNRNVIRKCIKNGLYVEESDDYDLFYEIYKETMDKVNAEDFYYLNTEMIALMRRDDCYHLLVCKKDDSVLAAAIFMGYGEYFHYHFAGSRKDVLNMSPNNILLWEAIRYAKRNGYKTMHLGGGLTDSTEDNLYRFKARFGKRGNDFFIGKRVINRRIYGNLIEEWEEKNKMKAIKLLQYKE